MRLLLIGAPGAGKGTQAVRLAEHFGITHISSGDLLRKHVEDETPFGVQIKEFVSRGDLVPDQMVLDMLRKPIVEASARGGYVLDGFPRTVAQAEALDGLLRRRGQDLDRVVFFDVPRDELIRRLTGRRVCRQCGAAFHLVSAPPKAAGRCDQCGGALYQREDDAEATVARRLDVYQTQTAPLLDYYRRRGLLVQVAGEGPVEEVADRIRRAVKEPVPR